MAEDELIKIPNLEDFIMSFVNLLVLNGVSIDNKTGVEQDIFNHIINSQEEFGSVRLKYNEYSCILEDLNPREYKDLILDVELTIFI